MPRHDPPNRVVTDPTPWRYVVGLAVLTLVLLAGGVAMGVGVFVVKFGSAAKAERLERDGVAVEANLTDYQPGRNLSSTVDLEYQYAGRVYRVEVECDDRKRCDPRFSNSLSIKVDPADPTELVTALGVTDDSTRFLDAWVRLVYAAILIGLGVVGAVLSQSLYRQARTERRLAAQRDSRPQPEP